MSTFTIAIPGLPERCPHCGLTPHGGGWPLSYSKLEIVVTCRACHSRIGRLVAAPPAEEG